MAAKRNGRPKRPRGSVKDLTVEILRQIRDEIVALRSDTSSRLDQTNSRLDQTNSRLDQTNSRLDELRSDVDGLRSDVDRLRSETAAGLLRHEQALGKLVRQGEDLASRFDNFLTGAHQKAHEDLRGDHERLRERVDRLEEHVGRH